LTGSHELQYNATPRHATPRHATPRHATPRHVLYALTGQSFYLQEIQKLIFSRLFFFLILTENFSFTSRGGVHRDA